MLVTLVGTSITFFKLNLQSRLVHFLFNKRSHEDDKLTLKSLNKMMLERLRHKLSITTENLPKKKEQSEGLYIEPIKSRWE